MGLKGVAFDCRSGDGDEKKDSSFMSGEVQGLGMMLPDRNAKKKGKKKASGESKDSHIAEALDKLREQTREAVKGLESVAGPRPGVENMGNDAMMEEWVKQFEELSGSQVSCLYVSLMLMVYVFTEFSSLLFMLNTNAAKYVSS